MGSASAAAPSPASQGSDGPSLHFASSGGDMPRMSPASPSASAPRRVGLKPGADAPPLRPLVVGPVAAKIEAELAARRPSLGLLQM